jgi:hypothetical protein
MLLSFATEIAVLFSAALRFCVPALCTRKQTANLHHIGERVKRRNPTERTVVRTTGSWSILLLNRRDPIPLPQRFRLLRAAKRIERVGCDPGAGLRQRVVWPKSLVMVGKSFLA